MPGSTHRCVHTGLGGLCQPAVPLSQRLGIPSSIPCPWEAVHRSCHSQSFRFPSYPFMLLICSEKPEQSCGTKSWGLRSKTCCRDTIQTVLFSVMVSFPGAFLEVCLNFNWFPLPVLKFYKPRLVNPLILAGSNIGAEETVMVRWSDSPKVTKPVSELALCEFGLCKLHLLVTMAKQRWHLYIRDDVTFPAAGLGSGLSISQWYIMFQARFARVWVSLLTWPPLFWLTFLLNQKREEEQGSSDDMKKQVLNLGRKCLALRTLKILNSAAVSRD